MGVRVAGLVVGLGLVCVLALQAWRLPASSGRAAVGVDLRAAPSGEVGVDPGGPVLARRTAAVGGPAVAGAVRVRNQTAHVLTVSPRLSGGDPALDRAVRAELSVDGRPVFDGPVGDLRSAPAGVVLRPGDAETVGVRIRVVRGSDDAAARSSRWTLTFAGEPVR